MSAPSHDDDQLKLEIFDSFSKTVMRNASRNFAAAAKTRKKNESVNTDIVQYIRTDNFHEKMQAYRCEREVLESILRGKVYF